MLSDFTGKEFRFPSSYFTDDNQQVPVGASQRDFNGGVGIFLDNSQLLVKQTTYSKSTITVNHRKSVTCRFFWERQNRTNTRYWTDFAARCWLLTRQNGETPGQNHSGHVDMKQSYPLVMTHTANWKMRFFNGTYDYFNGHVPSLY